MTYTILVNSDKSIEKTVFRPIFEKESRADVLQFLIDPDVIETEDITKCQVLLQVLIPHFNEETQKKELIGKMRYMDIEEELYLDMLRTTLPITTTLTETPGKLQLWFSFYDLNDPEKIRLVKTEKCFIDVLPIDGDSTDILIDEEFVDALTQTQQEIDALKSDKMDKNYTYDEEENTIQFYADGEPVGGPIPLGDEIDWKDWE